MKDESTWPTGTFKDRLAAAAIEQAGAAPTTFATLSYGNTAVSLVHFARAARQLGVMHRLVIIVPPDFEDWTFGPSSRGTIADAKSMLGVLRGESTVVPVDLSSSLLDDLALRQIAESAVGPSDRFINVTEGLDHPVYVDIIREAVEQLGRVPDVCVVPFGAGILANEVIDYLAKRGRCVVVPISVSSPSSMARMLYGPVWVDTVKLERDGWAYSRHGSPDRTGALRVPYRVWRITEDEIRKGLDIARLEQLSAEPRGAAGFGILHRLGAIVPSLSEEQTVLVINTGNGIDRNL